jgi:hypothetical protein
MINKIKTIINNHTKNKLIGIFPYGSQVYKNKKSEDYDFIVVVDCPYAEKEIHNRSDIDITIIDKNTFLEQCQLNHVRALEILFTPDNIDNYYCEPAFKSEIFCLRKSVLNPLYVRQQFSQKTSNSYVKAKKKIIISEDYDFMVSMKSLWHSIRILDFGKQMIESGKVNFQSMNNLYKEINKDYNNLSIESKDIMWDKLHEKYKPIFNEKHSELKKLCPKEKNTVKFNKK